MARELWENELTLAQNSLHFPLPEFPEIPGNREKFPGNDFNGISREIPGREKSGKHHYYL